MDYSEIRNKIVSGDIVFIKGNKNSLVDRLIMFFTRSKYSHVGIAFWLYDTALKKDRLMIVEAQIFNRLRIVNMSFYKGEKIDIVSSPLPWNKMGDIAFKRLGEVKYGWFDAAYVGIREWLLAHNICSLPKKNIDSGEICSEFVARVLNFKDRNLSPQKLFESLMKMGQKIKASI